MKIISAELSAKRATAGRKGGYKTFFTHGREKMRGWARRGGRPRSLTLEELMSQAGSRGERENERGQGCPPLNGYPPEIARALGPLPKAGYKKGEGSGRPARRSSPEGVTQ